MIFNETVIPILWQTSQYWIVVCNPDGSLVWGWEAGSTPYKMVAYYDETDLTYNYSYFCEALPWTLLNEFKWRVFRIEEDKDWKFISKKWAWTVFNNQATDLATVEALTFN